MILLIQNFTSNLTTYLQKGAGKLGLHLQQIVEF